MPDRHRETRVYGPEAQLDVQDTFNIEAVGSYPTGSTKLKCEFCDKETNNPRFCSKQCSDKSQRKLRPPCIVCRGESYSPISKFCSRSCSAKFYNKDRQIFRTCIVCGKEHRNKKYCSYKCSANDPARKKKTGHLLPEELAERKRLKNLLGVRRYQARRYQQTPIDADPEKIREIYANCPDGFEVDHKVPISKGGLHHQDNLQYLPKAENRKKSNKLNYTPMAERLGT